MSIREYFPDVENVRVEDELAADMLAVMASFAGHREQRSATTRSLRAVIQAEIQRDP